MVIDLFCENVQVPCLVEIDNNFISVSSNLLLHNLLQIDIQVIKKEDEVFCTDVSDNLNHKSFALNLLDCK
jgi:hypothetical protein